jgi:hypothetical protein
LGRSAIEYSNNEVHTLLNRYSDETLSKKHPMISLIIDDTMKAKLPRQLSGGTLLRILKLCPVISVAAAAEATEHRYARSSIAEYAALARSASGRIKEYLNASKRSSASPMRA